jgi:hypothetical protein
MWLHKQGIWSLSGRGFPNMVSRSLPHAETHVGLQVKCLLLVTDFNQNGEVLTNFGKTSNFKFNENPSSVLKLLHVEPDRHGEVNRHIFGTSGPPKYEVTALTT